MSFNIAYLLEYKNNLAEMTVWEQRLYISQEASKMDLLLFPVSHGICRSMHVTQMNGNFTMAL